MRKSFLALAWIASTMSVAHAGPSTVEGCRAVADKNLRLACYDAIPLSRQTTALPVTGEAASPRVPAAADPAQFGLDSRSRSERVDEVVSRIPGLFEGWDAKTRIKLENRQVWQVADGSRADYRLQNPAVRVRRGVLGGYVMEIEGVNQMVRVRRVE